jgi:glycosyltransferase involved in cell wall biosynthesis
MPSIRILYDGWPLLHAPLSAAAWQLRTLLAMKTDEVQPLLALPTEPEATTVNEGPELVFQHTHNRGEWEQRILPRLAEKHGAKFIHGTGMNASLFGKARTLISASEMESAGERSRIDEAQGRGGLARATLLWPEDIPAPKFAGKIQKLPATSHPDFAPIDYFPTPPLGLPDSYVLFHGQGSRDTLQKLFESWTWAAASIGEYYPLILLGLDAETREWARTRLPEFQLEESVRVLEDLDAKFVPAIYQACTVVVHPQQPEPWGGSLRHALACGKAVVAVQDANSEGIVGPAAYLVAADDLRAFGAATITLVVDEKARESMETAARQHGAGWKAARYRDELLKVYLGN